MELKEYIMSHDKIYSFLFGDIKFDSEIVEIDTSRLTWSQDGQECYFTWGWPGPDFNKYNLSNYTTEWAINKTTLEERVIRKELIESGKENNG